MSDVGRAGAGVEAAVDLVAGARAAGEVLVEGPRRQLQPELEAGDAGTAEPLPAGGHADVAEAACGRGGRRGVALAGGHVRTVDEGQLDVDAPGAGELVVERRREIMVVGVALDLAVGREGDRRPVDPAPSVLQAGLGHVVVAQGKDGAGDGDETLAQPVRGQRAAAARAGDGGGGKQQARGCGAGMDKGHGWAFADAAWSNRCRRGRVRRKRRADRAGAAIAGAA